MATVFPTSPRYSRWTARRLPRADLGLVFDSVDAPELAGPNGLLGEHPPADLARQMYQAWIAFAMSRNPGWASHDLQQRLVMRIDTDWSVLANTRGPSASLGDATPSLPFAYAARTARV